MKNRLWFAFLGLVFLSSVVRAGGDGGAEDVKIVRDLNDAVNQSPLLRNRIAAVAALGQLKSKNETAVKNSVAALTTFLNQPPPNVACAEKSLFLLHVVQALGDIGPAARTALPELVKVEGKDRTIDKAIEATRQSILKQSPAAPVEAKDNIASLAASLEKGKTAGERIAAAWSLGAKADRNNFAVVLPILLPALEKQDDADVRSMAAAAAKKALDLMADKDSPSGKKWRTDYANGLGGMLAIKPGEKQLDTSTKAASYKFTPARVHERLLAVRSLEDLGTDIITVPPVLLQVATSDPDPDVQSVATNAMTKIGGGKSKK